MTHYIDGFVIPVPKNNIDDYRRIAQKAGEVMAPWNIGNAPALDLDVTSQVPFPPLINSTPDWPQTRNPLLSTRGATVESQEPAQL